MKVFIAGAKGQLGHALQAVLGHHEIIAYDVDEVDIT